MGIAQFALLLARNSRRRHPLVKHRGNSLLASARTLATNAAEAPNTPQEEQQQEAGLGARLSFVVQQLEDIQKQKAEKMSALEKLRLWRGTTNIMTSNVIPNTNVEGSSCIEENEAASAGQGIEVQEGEGQVATVPGEIAHPWPEWLDLMERLVQENYFDKRRYDRGGDDDIVEKLSGGECSSRDENLDVFGEGFDVFRDLTSVRRACLDFGHDRFDILRSLSRKDIQILVGFGCPSVDKKVVLSGKRLRAHVHLDEGDVCSSCKLRNSCPTAYIVPRDEEREARTIDVLRILMIYGLDPLINSAENKLHKTKIVKTAIRKLLKEVVRSSVIPLDPNLPKPVFKRPPPKVKEPQPPPRKRVGRDDVEMKKGDWLCPKCDFMNFAKNSFCLQCEAERPKRLLNPGEWECPGCNFLNYRRNMTCYTCDHKRPEDEYTKSLAQRREGNDSQRSRYPNGRLERPLNMISSSKSWNNDFEDDESDGADVAAFEYGDSSRIPESPPMNVDKGGPPMNVDKGGTKNGHFDDDSFDFDDLPMHGRERTKRQNESEELEMHTMSVSSNDKVKAFNDFGDFDEDEDEDDSSLSRIQSRRSYERANIPSTSSIRNERRYDSGEHTEGYRRKGSERFRRQSLSSPRGRSKGTYDSFDEDEKDSFISESDEDETQWKRGNKGRRSMGRRGGGTLNKKGKGDFSEDHLYESDDEVSHFSRKNQKRGKDARFTGRGTSFSSRRKGSRDGYDFENDHGTKRSHGSVSRHKGAEGNWSSRGDNSFVESKQKSERGDMLFGPRRGSTLKIDSDFEDEPHNNKSRNDFFKGSPRSGRGASFRSRRGGRMQRDDGFGDPGDKGYNGAIKESRRKGQPQSRGRNAKPFASDMY